MRTQLAQLRHRWSRIPLRARMGLLVAVVAIMLLRREFRRRPRSLPLQTSAIGGGIAH